METKLTKKLNMGFWTKGVKRSETGDGRKENILTSQIEEFFNNREESVSYEIVDDKNWIVDVNGNLHLYQSDLDEGKLFFKIGKLVGNLYFHGKYMSPSVIPVEMDGEIIFVPDEGGSANGTGKKGNSEEEDEDLNMGLLTNKELTKPEILSNLKSSIADTLYSKYKDEVDIQEVLDEVKKQWEERD